LLPGEPGCVVDLGEDLDAVGAVLGRQSGLAEVAGDLPQVLGALLDRDPEPLPDDLGITLAEAGNEEVEFSGTSRKRAIQWVVMRRRR
jgi:hypothetical protein